MKSRVQTVLGPVPATELGLTLSHEHLLAGPPDGADGDRDLLLDDPDAAAVELGQFRAAGGGAVVEVTPPGYGQNLEGLAALSRKTGIHIVAATGLHKEQWSAGATSGVDADALAQTFIDQLRTGVGGVRAGVIKVGSSLDRITEGERKAFVAAARAQAATGAPITTHTEAGRLALEQLDLLLGAGADEERVVIGHLDRLLDLDYHRAVLRRGACVGYDQVGKSKYAADRQRAEALAELVRLGYGSQLLISGDLGRRSYWHAWGGAPGLEYIPRTFLATLCGVGLTPEQANALVMDNPARVFAYL